MATLIENGNETTIFAGNARDIRYECSGSLSLSVSIGQTNYTIAMDPIAGEVRVPLKQLLSALKIPSIGLLEGSKSISKVVIEDNDTLSPAHDVEIYVVPGKIGCEQEDVAARILKNFATWRPQICKVCKWGADRMYIMVTSFHPVIIGTPTIHVRLKAYTDAGLLSIDNLQEFSSPAKKIMSVPCDYATIENALHESEPELDFGEIIAYDMTFYWSYADITGESAAQRFVLARSRSDWRQFIFRNSLGVFDALYSTGSFSDVPEYDIIQFRNNEVDNEISNNVSQIFEVNTGRINDELERRMWKEFFESDERYILSPDDQTPRRIVLDDVSCEHTLRQNNVATFRFHFAEPDSGRLVQRGELPEWTDYGGRLITADGKYFKTSDGDYIYFKRF